MSFIMPWQDIIESMSRSALGTDMERLPRDPECLKYLVRLHLKVAHNDMHEKLRQVHLRPHILLLLLKELIDRRHPVFDGCGSAAMLRQRMERLVNERYPDTELDMPEDEK